MINQKNKLEVDLKQQDVSSTFIESESQRAIQEVQAAIIVAKRFPRNIVVSTEKILNACTRKTLAECALYSYNKGGTAISGASIRLAETLAQNWGNIQYGVRELSQANGVSTVEAFAWDVENNLRINKTFQVPHSRYSKAAGISQLTDSREIYEKVANDGARRLRACILSMIPGDIIESAVEQCEQTLKAKADTSPESVQKMLTGFESFNVTKQMIEKRIGNRVDAIRPAQIIQLKKIHTSLKDGISVVADWFDVLDKSTTLDIQTQQVQAMPFNTEIPVEAAKPAENNQAVAVDVKMLKLDIMNTFCDKIELLAEKNIALHDEIKTAMSNGFAGLSDEQIANLHQRLTDE